MEGKMKEIYKHLFEPIEIGNMVVQNRICHVPTDIGASYSTGESSDRDVYHHSQIAKGGTGLVVVGATTPEIETGKSTVNCTAADRDEQIPALSRLAEGIKAYGAKAGIQLEHPGRQGALPRYPVYSASDMVMRLPWSQSHEILYENEEAKGKSVRQMSTEDIINLVGKFSDAAWRCQLAGFDCIGLHAAHGYLISQFMSPYLNRRNDRYGGSLENRLRFLLEIISSIKRKCGKDFPIIVRYSADEWVEGGREIGESVLVAQILEQVGVAALDISQCIQESPGAGFDPMYYPEGWTVYASQAIKKAVKIPVIISHSLRTPAYCDKIIGEGSTDMVGLSRQLLADPYWPVKAKYGKDDEIRKCISCLTGCWQESHMAKRQVACAINPTLGNESFAKMKKADKICKIAVVGGGPAGMEAARHAAVRNHMVTLFERTGELGGAILGDCLVPGKEKMKWYADWVRGQIKKLKNVEVVLNFSPTVEDLKKFDIIANATGASSFVPKVFGNAESVVPFEDVLACPKVNCEFNPGGRKMAKVGDKVLVWGDHYAAVDTAQFLASIGKDVTIVTENPVFAAKVETIHMYVARKRFALEEAEALNPKPYKHAVKVMEGTTVVNIADSRVTVQDKDFKFKELPIDTVVTCHLRANIEFMEKLREAGLQVVNIGDSVLPRNLHAAVMDGAVFGKNVEGDALTNPNNAPVNDLPIDVLDQMIR
jgi:2,4-dienoyl-CoA reductase-like NADH-dependent reductase (Old Yellow Enzyme family)/thioredoxin reductase